MSVTSAAQAVQATAEREMLRVWQYCPDFNKKVEERFQISYWKGLAQRSKDSVPAYGNRYKDSI